MAGEPDDPGVTVAGGAEDAAAFFRQLGEQTSKVLTAAEEAGRGIREQARRDAAGIVAEARLQADELARAAALKRRAAEEELRRFREARSVLANQIEDVHRRLEEVILRLRAPVEVRDAGHPKAAGGGATRAGEGAGLAEDPAGTRLHLVDSVQEAAPGGIEPEPDPDAAGPQLTLSPPPEPPAASGLPEPPEAAAPPEPAPEPESEPAPQPDPEPLHEPEPELEPEPEPEPQPEPEPEPEQFELGAFALRAEAIGEAPLVAGRTLKRLLQEDQNDLLDRIRRHRGRGTFEEAIFPGPVQVERFVTGLRPVLQPAFLAGRRAAGAPAIGEPPDTVANLVSKQVVAPLRRDLARMIEPRLAAGDTATTVSERAGDVYRVWKGVRTELLGEGLAYAAFHHGLLDAWREVNGPGKRWAMSPDEADCPRDTCRTNSVAGAIPLDASFPSGHLAPPAHGACTCTIVAAGE